MNNQANKTVGFLILIFLLFTNPTTAKSAIEQEVIVTGGSTVGNGGGQDEINVFYQIQSLKEYVNQIKDEESFSGIKSIANALDSFHREPSELLFLSEEEFRGDATRLFYRENAKLQVNSKKLAQLSESLDRYEMDIEIISEFIDSLFEDSGNISGKTQFLSQVKARKKNLQAINLGYLGYKDVGISFLDLTGNTSFYITDTVANRNITDKVLFNLHCDKGEPKLLSSTSPFWKNETSEIEEDFLKVFAEVRVTYQCDQKRYQSYLTIEMAYALKDENVRLQDLLFFQWNINTL